MLISFINNIDFTYALVWNIIKQEERKGLALSVFKTMAKPEMHKYMEDK